MTNSLFPSSAFFRRHFNSSRNLRVALILALIALVSSLPFYSFAQGDTVPVKKSREYRIVPNRGSFVLNAGANGETLCREATAVEALALRNGRGRGLTQINHLDKGLRTESTTAGMKIVLLATDQLNLPENAQAKAAFIAAAAKWEAVVQDPITIAVEVDFGTTFFGEPFSSADVIGATQSNLFSAKGNYPVIRGSLVSHSSPGAESALINALPQAPVPADSVVPTDIGPVDTVVVSSPLLRALNIIPSDYTTDEPTDPWKDPPRIGFNTNFGFDFDPSDGITGNRTDFDAVAVHEMGHLLGFESAVGVQELEPTSNLAMTIWDLFRFSPGTANLANFGTAQRILSSGATPTTQHVQFNGGAERGLSTGKPDGTGGDLEQASHWKEDGGQPSFYIGIMDPTIARNRRELMTEADKNAIDYFGYTTTPVSAPPNDNFAATQVITGNSGSVSGSNRFATKETGEPTHDPGGDPSGKSIWYRWTAPNSGTVNITTLGSQPDTLLAVYTGTAVNALTLPGENFRNDDVEPGVIRTSTVTFAAISGTTYQIAVDGWNGDQGSVVLNWNLPGGPPPTVQFASGTGTVAENAGGAVATVTRTGDTSGAVSIGYSTSDGTATVAGGDYTSTTGTLNFAAGETSKNIIVPINNDTAAEPNETFNVGLNNPSAGLTMGTPSTRVITITANDSAPPNTVQFNLSNASVTETPNATAKVDLTVTRTGTTTGAATVNYAASDVTAQEESDYITAVGTLRFAAGEVSKTITVLIVDDSLGETPETFNLTLSSPVGCTLGTQATVVVTINSNTGETVSGVNGPNPVKDPSFNSDFFVRQQYFDFLNRTPDASGLAFWKNEIDQCELLPLAQRQPCREVKRINVSAAFFVSIEFQQTGYLAYKAYQAAFDTGETLRLRDFLADTQEIGRGVVFGAPGADALLEANKLRFFEDFVQRPNFLLPAAYPNTMTAAQFVNKLDLNTYDPRNFVSGGALTTSQRISLINLLAPNPASPTLRAQVLRQIAENSIFNTRQFSKAFVLMQYFGYLRRNPNDPPDTNFEGYNFWLNKLNTVNGNYILAEMVRAFLDSDEYKLRFGPK